MRGVLGLLLIVGGFTLVILMLTGHLTFPGVNAPASTTGSSAGQSGQPQSPGTPHTVQAGAATGGSGAGGGF